MAASKKRMEQTMVGGGRKEREKNPSYEEKIFVGGANKSRKPS